MSFNTKVEFKKNIKASKTTVTAYQLPGSSWENVSGSVIAYTPAAGSSHVVYEYVTQMDYKDDDNDLDLQLQTGSNANSLSDITANNAGYFCSFGGNNTTNSNYTTLINIRFMIPTSNWSGEKTIALQAKNDSASYESYLHYSSYANSLISSDESLFHPFVIVYSI